ncbi:protein RALF-like 19 [Beta vulgaris subsp. vulgaris]|uniref:protein RALF-like 19 n=1 Tax=Beta vulgaris subsp. vulgaris TaxID=3555 RepID=UPI002036C369|nr:protein RALF-like 19 [Beta vulgaris subsp. vulgaris]
MASKLWLIALFLALMVVTESSSSFDDSTWGLSRLTSKGDGDLPIMRTCNGRIGDCIGDEEEEAMDVDDARRQLAGRRRYISYDALKKNNVPCNRRGQSYYNCRSNARANPYNRGCSYITHCARNLG